MKFKTKYKLTLWKTYVDRGRGLTSYFNELFLIFGFSQVVQHKGMWNLVALVVGYALLCFLLGYFYFKHQWQLAETEVTNQYNLFVGEVRQKLKRKRVL